MHQDCNTYIKIRHINIKAHIYMFNELHLHQDSCTSYMKTRIPLDIKREESCLIVFGEWKYAGNRPGPVSLSLPDEAISTGQH